jgi:hypothetical protein
VLQLQIQTAAYWTTDLKITRADIEALFAHFLETEQPLTAREVALFFIKQRLAAEQDRFRKQLANVTLFQPVQALRSRAGADLPCAQLRQRQSDRRAARLQS